MITQKKNDTQINRLLGIAVNEAILATAMVASFGVFVAVSVPWGSVVSTDLKVVDGFKAIEKANIAFFNEYHMWPHQMTDGNEVHNVSALVSPEVLRYPYSVMTHFKNFLPEYKTNASVVKHHIGSGGVISQKIVEYQGEPYMEVTFKDVPLRAARRIDEEMDGIYDPEVGKVYFTFKDGTEVDIHYRANRLKV